MKIVKTGAAGTLESSDVMITVRSNGSNGIEIDLNSIVEKQFGKQIHAVVKKTLADLQVEDALIGVQDKGALDCAIEARLITAVYRAAGIEQVNWEALS